MLRGYNANMNNYNLLIKLAKVSLSSFNIDVKQSEINFLNKPNMMELFVNEVRRHNVWPQVFNNLNIICNNCQEDTIRQFISASNSREKNWMNDFPVKKLNVFNLLGKIGKPVLLLKGGALLGLYPENSPRWIRDIDIYLPDARACWDTINYFHENGYVFDKTKNVVIQNIIDDVGSINNNINGGAILVTNVKEKGFKLDIKFGKFLMNITSDVFKRSKSPKGQWDNILFPSPEDSILIIISHGIIHGTLKVRDINDLWVLMYYYGNEIDKDYIIYHAKKTRILSCLKYALDIVEEIYDKNWIISNLKKDLNCSYISRVGARIFIDTGMKNTLEVKDLPRLITSFILLEALSANSEIKRLIFYRWNNIKYLFTRYPLLGKIVHRIQVKYILRNLIASLNEPYFLTLTPIILSVGKDIWQPDRCFPYEISKNIKESEYKVTYIHDVNLTIIWGNIFALVIAPYFTFLIKPPLETDGQKKEISQEASLLLNRLLKINVLKLRKVSIC